MLEDNFMTIKDFRTMDFEYSSLKNSTFFITGATGLLGSALVETLIKLDLNIKIIVFVRSKEKAYRKFGEAVKYYVGDIQNEISVEDAVDYVIHCANPTSSSFFVKNPVETIETAVNGSFNILKFSLVKKPQIVIFLSTMEIHGTPQKGVKVHVEDGGSFDTQKVRNCYPLSKMLCENLFLSYHDEYNLNTCVLRLTQTFGPGIEYDDNRVFAEFARCVIEQRDIVLKTKGTTERSYLYVSDAIDAILKIILNGVPGNVYTAANESTYCSIYDMAQLVARKGNINVVIKEMDINKFGYANELYMDLDTSKLQDIGWKAKVGLSEAYDNLIEYMKNKKR